MHTSILLRNFIFQQVPVEQVPEVPAGFISDAEHVQLQRRYSLLEMRAAVLAKQEIVKNQRLLTLSYQKSIEKDEQVIKTQKVMEEFFLAKGCIEHELILKFNPIFPLT